MARIDEVAEGSGGVLTRLSYRYSRKRFGKVLGPMRVLANSETSLLAYGAYEMISARADSVDARLKDLAVLKTSTLVGCPF